jgi:hypothetical protein
MTRAIDYLLKEGFMDKKPCWDCTNFKGIGTMCQENKEMPVNKKFTLTGCTQFQQGKRQIGDGIVIYPNGLNNLEHFDKMEPVLLTYSKLLNKGIIVTNPHQVSEPPYIGPDLWIKFWCTVPPTTNQQSYPKVFNIDLEPGQRDGLAPTKNGLVIKDGKQIIAEAHKDTLYVLFDLPHGENADKILDKIMNQYLLLMDPIKLQEILDAKEKEQERISEQVFIDHCMEQHVKNYDTTQTKLKEDNDNLVKLGEIARQKYLNMEQTKKHLSQLTEETDSKRFEQEFQTLLNTKHVKKVEMDNSRIAIYTDTVYIKFKKDVYELGDYVMYFHRDTISIQNLRQAELTHQDHYHHPHIFEGDGTNVCLGNITHGIKELLRNYEYATVAQIMIEFLHTFKPTEQYIGWLERYWTPLEGKVKTEILAKIKDQPIIKAH